MAKKSFTRREFLKFSALSSSAATLGSALGGCTSLDRLFMGDKRDLTNEVVILGAGAAGLAAAYSLKKNKIPFRVFEASARIGGRVQSVSLFPEGGPVAELGAEFFEESHRSVFDLAKELNLPVREVKLEAGLEAHLFSFGGRTYRVKDLSSRLKTLNTPLRRLWSDLYHQEDAVLTYRNNLQFERAAYYDSLSLQELLESWSNEVDPLVLKLIEAQAVSRFGVDADTQSALHFLTTVDGEGSSLLAGRRTFRMEGGLSRLMQTLHGRVAGVIPDFVVKTNNVLSEISEDKGRFELTFKTPSGRETYVTKNVICTLPFSKLREVQGLHKLQFSLRKKDAILAQDYATHSKGAMTFTSAFWRKKSPSTPANLGNFTGDFLSQKFWDSARAQDTQDSGAQSKERKALLTFQRAGKSGAQLGGASIQEAVNDLTLFYPEINLAWVVNTQMINWSQRPWVAGSMAYFRKGQYMRFKGVAGEPEYGGHFLFAGEHTSLQYAGTLHGALDSGLAAAAGIANALA